MAAACGWIQAPADPRGPLPFASGTALFAIAREKCDTVDVACAQSAKRRIAPTDHLQDMAGQVIAWRSKRVGSNVRSASPTAVNSAPRNNLVLKAAQSAR